jgi:hypothetical protein
MAAKRPPVYFSRRRTGFHRFEVEGFAWEGTGGLEIANNITTFPGFGRPTRAV